MYMLNLKDLPSDNVTV